MPTYVYENCHTIKGLEEGTLERNVPIAERDNQKCYFCEQPLKRLLVFKGLTWAPTAGGMR